ncbi:cell division protein FtsA [Hydrogenivirga caldilitoris]|uniref:Cell division protein FtsA n=1 Tax=Hydrogenivirga caldilitoris TaxID=246264 RepID=A0A497XN58_9AQUI|nr:cell division protein FtsA [Hydrogenivirga caldilitoris]RLJ70355.1 cell division protein FtsA [Hydrogenivirga caldilitoris]
MKTVASIDIGTDKIVALIGEVDTYGDLHIVGVGESKARGVDKGTITRLEVAARAIATAVREAEEMSGQKVSEVVINVSGSTIKSQNEKDTINISPSPVEVENEHIQRLVERSIARGKEDGYEIIHAIPRRYMLDDQEGIEDPVGLIGSKLTAQVHIVKVGTTVSRNIEKAVVSAGFQPAMRVASAIASAKAVLSDEEKEEGVLLIDMGASLTDFVLYLEGYPVITGSLPLAGNAITKDISSYMKIDPEHAEKIKREQGVALVNLVKEGEIIKIKPRGEDRDISIEKTTLAEVIQIRLEEIIEKIVEKIDSSGYKIDIANAGVVITGGCANLKGIKEFVERFTDLPARIGVPSGIIGLKEKIEDAKYATAVGLLKFRVSPEGIIPGGLRMELHSNGPGKGINFGGMVEKFKNFLREIM